MTLWKNVDNFFGLDHHHAFRKKCIFAPPFWGNKPGTRLETALSDQRDFNKTTI